MEFMDVREEQEGAREDFKILVKMFNKNFSRLSIERLREFEIKVSALADVLRDKQKKDY